MNMKLPVISGEVPVGDDQLSSADAVARSSEAATCSEHDVEPPARRRRKCARQRRLAESARS